MKRFIFAGTAMILAQTAQADMAPGFQAGVADCLATISNMDDPFPMADEVEGDATLGFVAWYHDETGEPKYAVRLGVKGTGADEVISCQGPAPMGPSMDDFLEFDQGGVTASAANYGLEILTVPAEGVYYANCAAEIPNLLIALTYDATSRTGVQVVKSGGVAQTCEKFAP